MSIAAQAALKSEIHARLVARARELAPVLRKRASAAEQSRRLSDETIREFVEAGFFRIFQPARYGGFELDYGAIQLDLAGEIGRACGSSAWVTTVMACHSWMLGMFPRQAQDDVWGETPEAILSSGVMPDKAQAEPVAGGFSLSGRWRFSSGVDHADWAVLGTPTSTGMVWCVIPRRDFRIEDTWRVSGLRGTGSNDVVIDKAFVPEHRTVSFPQTLEGAAPAAKEQNSHIYRLPLFSVFPYNICAPALGIARGAMEDYAAYARARSAPPNLRYAEAGAQIDASTAVLRQNAREINDTLASGGVLTMEQRTRVNRDLSYAAQQYMRAVDTISYMAGAHGLFEDNPLQRALRDVHAVNAQIGLRWEMCGMGFAQAVLGGGPTAGH